MESVAQWLHSWHHCLLSSNLPNQRKRETTSPNLLSMRTRLVGFMAFCPSVLNPVKPRRQKCGESQPFEPKKRGKRRGLLQ